MLSAHMVCTWHSKGAQTVAKQYIDDSIMVRDTSHMVR